MKRPYSPDQLCALLDLARQEGAVHRVSVNPLTYADFRKWGKESIDIPNIMMGTPNAMAFGVPIMVVRTVRDGLVLVLDSDGSVLAHDMTGCDPHPGRIQGCALCLPHEVLES